MNLKFELEGPEEEEVFGTTAKSFVLTSVISGIITSTTLFVAKETFQRIKEKRLEKESKAFLKEVV